ncbi:MAG: TonB-dependent receptor, partial [Bacteroidetes bacterium]|nr:TonB-dependent receptor [Bacteroidota bacterium]
MRGRLYMIAWALVLAPALVFAANTGKIRGKLTDKATGEPLVGASVVIKGTSLGASADVNGEYVILNVSPGAYTLEGKYLGYQPLGIENVRVSSDLTTEVNFALDVLTEGIQIQEIVVRRERELVSKNATNAVRISTTEDVKNLPVRGVVSAVVLAPGVVQQGGDIFIRGGRSEEVGYVFEGANARDVISGDVVTVAIPEALEEFQVQAGGYTAQYGGANAGIIKQSLRSGTPDFKFSLQAETDNFTDAGKDYLGGYSYGYIVVPDGSMPGQMRNRYTVNGTITFDYNPIIVRVGGAFSTQEQKGGRAVSQILNLERNGLNEFSNFLGNVKITHVVSPTFLYEVNINYNDTRTKNTDPLLGDNFLTYSDSLANAALGYGSAWRNYTTQYDDYDVYG